MPFKEYNILLIFQKKKKKYIYITMKSLSLEEENVIKDVNLFRLRNNTVIKI